MILSGSKVQTVYFSNSISSGFKDLIVTNPYGMVYGDNLTITILTLLGNFFLGVKDGADSAATDLVDIITNPSKIAEGVEFLLQCLTSEEERAQVLKLIEDSIVDTISKLADSDGNTRARMVGKFVGEVIVGLIADKAVIDVLNYLKGAFLVKINNLLENGQDLGGVKKYIDDLGAGAAEAIAKARNYIVNAIDDALTEFRRIIRGSDYYEVEFADPFGNIIKERIPFNEIDQAYFSKIDEAVGFTNKIEQVLDKMQTYEQARNKALEIVGDLGYDSKPYVGRLGTGEGKIVGRQSADGKVRWRLDYDPEKRPHINVEDFRNGKGISATKIAIPFEGDINTIEALLKVLNQ